MMKKARKDNKTIRELWGNYLIIRREYWDLKNTYKEKIDNLDIREQAMEFKRGITSFAAFVPSVSKKNDEQTEKIKKVREDLSSLKKERNERICKKKKELIEIRRELIDGIKKSPFIVAVKKHKKIIITVFAALIFIPIVLAVISSTITAINIENEEKRNFFIKTESDSFSFECNIDESSLSDNSVYEDLHCEKNKIVGEYSLYNTISLIGSVKTDGNTFLLASEQIIPNSVYATENFDKEKIQEAWNKEYELFLDNSLLKRTVSKKIIKISTTLNENDKSIIIKKHNQWAKYKEEEKARMEKEEKERKEAEEKQRKQAEIESKKNECATKTDDKYNYSWDDEREVCNKTEKNTSRSNNKSNSSSNAKKSQNSGITGYCKDGTPATGSPSARGKANSCYGHGGWRR